MLTKQERTELVRVDHTYDGEAVADLVRALLLRGRSLIEIELALRDAGCASYLIANGTGFEIVIGVRAARARLVARIVAERELAEVVRLSDQGTIASLIALAREGGVHL
jgi:hypothetical protein